MLSEKEKITSENQFAEQRPECSLVAGSKRKKRTSQRMKAEKSGFIVVLSR